MVFSGRLSDFVWLKQESSPLAKHRLGAKILFHKIFGAVAQLGERKAGSLEVVGSIPTSSTTSH
jgi:hypothetical protein